MELCSLDLCMRIGLSGKTLKGLWIMGEADAPVR